MFPGSKHKRSHLARPVPVARAATRTVSTEKGNCTGKPCQELQDLEDYYFKADKDQLLVVLIVRCRSTELFLAFHSQDAKITKARQVLQECRGLSTPTLLQSATQIGQLSFERDVGARRSTLPWRCRTSCLRSLPCLANRPAAHVGIPRTGGWASCWACQDVKSRASGPPFDVDRPLVDIHGSCTGSRR